MATKVNLNGNQSVAHAGTNDAITKANFNRLTPFETLAKISKNFREVGRNKPIHPISLDQVRMLCFYATNGEAVFLQSSPRSNEAVFAYIEKLQTNTPKQDGYISRPRIAKDGTLIGSPTWTALVVAAEYGYNGMEKKENPEKKTSSSETALETGRSEKSDAARSKDREKWVWYAGEHFDRAKLMANDQFEGGLRDMTRGKKGNQNRVDEKTGSVLMKEEGADVLKRASKLGSGIVGFGEWISGGIQSIGAGVAFIPGFLDNALTRAGERADHAMRSEWKQKGFWHKTLAVLAALGVALSYLFAFLFNSTALGIDMAFGWTGEAAEWIFNKAGGAFKGPKENTSNRRSRLRDEGKTPTGEAEKVIDEDAKPEFQTDKERAAVKAKADQLADLRKSLNAVEGEIKAKNAEMKRLEAKDTTLSSTKIRIDALRSQIAEAEAYKAAIKTDIETLTTPAAAPLATDAPAKLPKAA